MSTSDPGSKDSSNNIHDYLVRARSSATLVRVLEFVTKEPSFTLLRQLGPPEQPHTLVITTSEDGAAALRRNFANELIVERDRPLQMF